MLKELTSTVDGHDEYFMTCAPVQVQFIKYTRLVYLTGPLAMNVNSQTGPRFTIIPKTQDALNFLNSCVNKI